MHKKPDHNRDAKVHSTAVDEEKESITDTAARRQGAADVSRLFGVLMAFFEISKQLLAVGELTAENNLNAVRVSN